MLYCSSVKISHRSINGVNESCILSLCEFVFCVVDYIRGNIKTEPVVRRLCFVFVSRDKTTLSIFMHAVSQVRIQ